MSRLKYLNNNDGSMALFDTGLVNESQDRIVKEALVFVEGTHTDSAKRTHEFSADRVKRIVRNTNKFLANGGRIPWQRDHLKTQDANIGDLEGPLELRVITEEDLPNPNLKHLVGKLGAFTKALVGKGRSVVEEVSSKRISTLSPGIDVINDFIKEISATPVPAITGLSTFKLGEGPVTFEELESENNSLEEIKDKFDELSDMLWLLIENITSSDTVTQTGSTPKDLVNKALEDYKSRLMALLNLETAGKGVPGNFDPNYLNKQQESGNTMYKKYDSLEAAFTMADVEDVLHEDIASFGYRKAITSGIKALQNRKTTGKTVGSIVKATGRKVMNATRGKVATIGRKLSSLGRGVKEASTGLKTVKENGLKLSKGQAKRSTKAKKKFGVTNPKGTANRKMRSAVASAMAMEGSPPAGFNANKKK